MDQAIYRNGRRHSCGDLSEELTALRHGQEGFIWIGLKDPTPEEFAEVNSELNLHHLAVEDALKGNQRAKIEQYESSLFMVLKTLRYIEATSDIETGEVMVFTGDRFVVTVRRGEANPLAGVRSRLEVATERLRHGPDAVLHAVMDSVVDNYVLVDREVSMDLDAIETQVFAATGDEDHPPHPHRGAAGQADAEAIYRLKREVLEFRRASAPLADALTHFMERGAGKQMDVEMTNLFRDVGDHLRQVNDHVESYDRLLTDVLTAHLTGVSVQQNEDMRKISAWVAIAAVPTMIAGIYGMNFDNMPELHASIRLGDSEFQYGYFVIVGVMVGACLYLYRLFKRSGWL